MSRKNPLKKALKYLPAVLGSAAGTYVGGPAGGMIGGTLGGTTARGKGNKLKGALAGAGIGTAYGAAAPMLFEGMGGNPLGGGAMARMTGANGPSLLSQLGLESAPKMGGGLGFVGNFGNNGILQSKGKGIFGKEGIGKSLFNKISGPLAGQAPGAAIAGGGNGIEFFGSPGIMGGAPLPQGMGDSNSDPRLMNIASNPNSSALEKLLELLQMLGMEKEIKPANKAGEQALAKGGYVHGDSGGQDDDVYIDIPEGSYVEDATTVSLLGDGNSENGKKKLIEWEKKVLDSPYIRAPKDSYNMRMIKAKVSPSEFIHSPEFVDAVGRGRNENGAKALDKFRDNLRSHKGVKKFLPPKSKPISHYIGGKVH